MRTWLRRSVVGLFGASVLAGGLAACSHHPHHGGWGATASDEDVARWQERVTERIAAELELDAAQKQRLAALATVLREQRAAWRAGAPDARAELQNLVKDAHFDRWRAQELVNAKLAALRDSSPKVIAAAADFYDGLNAAQQQQVREFMARRRSRWHWG